ncbi:Tfp pilus assembly protein PilF [Chitinophaga skermanii]|uniref:Tfp pilus assembly protein PilF n=1 Tax=Chitinophaga skermanii TaxID=331697 RepID=A0A327QGU4_9BACT|nr:tetratricopeptide repeat protein [Chitinophaga skermanii]RAJ03846.1 Tfp pilus assembly protein PilF [Chitinophaga skermanii]
MKPVTKIYFVMVAMLCFAWKPATAQSSSAIDKTIVMEYLQLQQYDQAIAYLNERAQRNDPKELGLLAYAYYLNGQTLEAEQHYREILTIDPKNITALQYLASIQSAKELYPKAIEYYLQLIDLVPNNATYYRNLSFACTNAQKSDSAFKYLQISYGLNPNDVKVVARLAEIYLEQKNYSSADSILDKYLLRDSSQLSIINPSIRSAYNQNNYDKVIALGELLVRSHIVSANSMTYVTVAYYIKKDYNSAIRTYEFLNAFNAASPTVMYYAALSYSAKKEFDNSNELLAKCIELTKNSALSDYYAAMGDNFNAMKKFKTAIQQFDTAYYLVRSPVPMYQIATIYDAKLSQPQTAKRFYTKYLKEAENNGNKDAAVEAYVKERLKQIN